VIVRAAVLVVTVLAAAGCGSDGDRRSYAGQVRQPAPQVDTVELPDASAGGAPFAFRAADGGLLAVYFGYTHCPDVCPTTLADLRAALRDLGGDADRVGVAMVTIDPERDTGDVLTRYVQSFVDGAHAVVTDDDAQLQQAADAFGVTYSVTAVDGGEPEVVHSGFLYAVDDTGRLRLSWPFGTSADDIGADLDQLLEEVSR
jgi:protein SCO1/2